MIEVSAAIVWALLDSNQAGRGKERKIPASYEGGSRLATSWRQTVRRIPSLCLDELSVVVA